MSTNEQLLQQIDDLVASKTLGFDALEGIKSIKDSSKRTLDSLEAANAMLKAERERSAALQSALADEQARVAELRKTITEIREDGIKGRDAVWEKKIAEASAAAYKDAMAMVFKPNAVRESVQRQVVKPVEGHPGGNGGYPTPGFLATGQESETVVREDA